MLAASCLVSSLLTFAATLATTDRQDANNFFAEFDGIPTASPSSSPQANSVQQILRLKNYGRRLPTSPESRRSSKPGLFPQLEKKPDTDPELAKSIVESYADTASYRQSADGEGPVHFTSDGGDNIAGISVEKFLNSRDDIIQRKRSHARHRLAPALSSRESTTQRSAETFGNENQNIPRNHKLQRFRQRLILGSSSGSQEKTDNRSPESNRNSNSRENVRLRNAKIQSASQEELRQRSGETFLTDKEVPSILNPEFKQRSRETVSNEFVNQRSNENPTRDVARSSKLSEESFLTDKDDFISNNNYNVRPQQQKKIANHEKIADTPLMSRNNQNQNFRSNVQGRENIGRLSAESFLTDKEDQYYLSDQNFKPRSQSRQNQVEPDGARGRSSDTILPSRTVHKQSRSESENRNTAKIDRSSKGSSETFLTDKEDPFLDRDYVIKLRDKTNNRAGNQIKSTVLSGETFLTDEDDKNYFPPKQQSSRENSLQRSSETFLTDKEDFPGRVSNQQSRPLAPRRRPNNRPPPLSSETFLTDADDPPGLRRPNSKRPFQIESPRSQESSTPSSDESFLTDNGTLPPKRGRYRPVTSSPSSNENSIVDSDNFLTDNEPNPIPPPQPVTAHPKYLGRVRWPPPKSAESDESNGRQQQRFKPLFYEDIKAPEQSGSQENRNDHSQRKGYVVNRVQGDDHREVNNRPVPDDDGRPPIYDDHHPFLEFEDRNEKPRPSSHENEHYVAESDRNHNKDDDEEENEKEDETSKEEDEAFPGDGDQESEEEHEESPISELDSEESPHPEHHESGETPHREPNNNESAEAPPPAHSQEESPGVPAHSHEKHPNQEESHEEHPNEEESHEEHPNQEESHEDHPHPLPDHSHEDHPHPPPNQSHEDLPHPPPNQSHEDLPHPPPNQSHEEHPPSLPHQSHEEQPSTNNVDSDEHPTHSEGPEGHPPTSDEEGGGHEEEERPDYDERPPDYDSIRPTPEYEDGGTHSEEDGRPSSESGHEQGSSAEHQEEPDFIGPGPSEEEQEPDYPEGPPRKNKKGRPVPDYDGGPNQASGEHSGERGEEENASPEFNFDSFEFPDDVMEPPPSSENFGSTTRRPGGTRRPTSLPDDCPGGDEASSPQPPFDLLKAKRPVNTVRPLPRPGDEVSIAVAGPSAVKVRPTIGSTTTTRRPVTISALGVVKPGGEIIAKVVQAGSSTTTSTTHRPPGGTLRSARLRPGAQWGNKVKRKQKGSSTTTPKPNEEPWRSVLAAREATALTYLKPPPVGQPQTWLQTAPPPSPMFRLFVV